jgi:hypothetical protein
VCDGDVVEHGRLGRASRVHRRIAARSLGFVANARQHAQERCDGARIEGLAGFLFDERDRRINGHRLVIGACRGQRAEVVHETQDARAEGSIVAFETAWIAAAIPAFVMAENQRCNRIRKRDRRDDSAPTCGCAWTF